MQCHPLFLSAGKLIRIIAGFLGQTYQLEEIQGFHFRFLLARPQQFDRPDGHVFQYLIGIFF
ncbi:MAG: hypothetical protein WA705_31655 [Candidatus Ozemobacteraceae bacterium]